MTGEPAAERASRLRSYGRIAGWLFIIGAIAGLPSSLLVEPPPAPTDYLLTVVGIASGAICLSVPWERLPLAAFHLVAFVATAEIALVVLLFDPLYGYLFFVVAVYAAYVFPRLEQVIPQLIVIWLVTCLPALYDPDEAARHLRFALFALPVISLGAGMISFRRMRLAELERGYASLIGETAQAATRIRRTLHPGAPRPERGHTPGPPSQPEAGGGDSINSTR